MRGPALEPAERGCKVSPNTVRSRLHMSAERTDEVTWKRIGRAPQPETPHLFGCGVFGRIWLREQDTVYIELISLDLVSVGERQRVSAMDIQPLHWRD